MKDDEKKKEKEAPAPFSRVRSTHFSRILLTASTTRRNGTLSHSGVCAWFPCNLRSLRR